jgi:signal peptidase I
VTDSDGLSEATAVTGTDEGSRGHSRASLRRKTAKRTKRPSSPRRTLVEWGIVALVALALAFGMRTFVFQAYFVPSGSMIPTLQVGDRILVQKIFFSASSLHTGDIVVFHGPAADSVCGSPQSILVKRVIGLPGETIQSKGNNVYLNNKLLAEPWLPAGTQLGRAIPKQQISTGRYFMMGDNRSISCDSRYWGTIPASSIIGKVLVLWWRFGRPAFHVF